MVERLEIVRDLLSQKEHFVPVLSSSKQPNAFFITSSGSVPFSFSPNIVRNIVKLMGPGASIIIPSRYWSVGFLPGEKNWKLLEVFRRSIGFLVFIWKGRLLCPSYWKFFVVEYLFVLQNHINSDKKIINSGLWTTILASLSETVHLFSPFWSNFHLIMTMTE